MRHLPALSLGFGMALFSSSPVLAQDTPTEADLSAPAETTEDDRELTEDDKLAEEEEEGGGGEAAEASVGFSDIMDKVHLAVRLGFGVPFGVFSGEGDLSAGGITYHVDAAQMNDSVTAMVPIWLDLGYFLTPNIMLGLYGHYAFVLPKGCADSASCSGNDIRIGLQGQYHLKPGGELNPWFGLGVGYEFWNGFVEVEGQESSLSFKGFEFVNLQGGADFKLTKLISAGPFLSISVGQYSSVSSENAAGSNDADVEPKGLHEWVVVGGRATFDL
jgi:outer membrane protein W